MAYDYLMNTATGLFFICYIPELYANWKNKNANIYNVPEKIIIVIATGFAFSYSILNKDDTLIANYAPLLALDAIALLMRVYYMYKNKPIVIVAEIPLSRMNSEASIVDTRPLELAS